MGYTSSIATMAALSGDAVSRKIHQDVINWMKIPGFMQTVVFHQHMGPANCSKVHIESEADAMLLLSVLLKKHLDFWGDKPHFHGYRGYRWEKAKRLLKEAYDFVEARL